MLSIPGDYFLDEYISYCDFNEYKDKIVKLMKNYSFKEAHLYVYTINSYVTNKPLFSLAVLLNAALCECPTFLNVEPSYQRLVYFFNEVKSIVKETPFIVDTYNIINDIGECKLKYDGEVYSYFLGTGYDNTYSMVRSIPLFKQNEKVLKDILLYNSNLINKLYDNEEILTDFCCPTEEFYQRIIIILQELIIPDFIINNFEYERNYAYKSHVLKKNKDVYPLFNVSLLVDYYAYLVENANYNLEEMVNKRLHENFSAFEFNNKILYYPCRIIDMSKNEKIDYIFSARVANGSIFAIDEECEKNVIDKEYKLLKECTEEKSVSFVERIRRDEKGCLAVNIISGDNIMLSIRPINSPYLMNDILNETLLGVFSISFLDLIFLLDFANMNEIYEFIKSFNELEGVQCYNFDVLCSFYVWNHNHKVMFQGSANINTLMYENNMGDIYAHEFYTNKMVNYPMTCNDWKYDNIYTWDILENNRYVSRVNNLFAGTMYKLDDTHYVFSDFNIKRFMEFSSTEEGSRHVKLYDDVISVIVREYGNLFTIFKENVIEFMFSPINGFEKSKIKVIDKYVYAEPHIHNNIIMFLIDFNMEELEKDLKNPKDCSVEIAIIMEIIGAIKRTHYKEYCFFRKEVEKYRDLVPHFKMFEFKMNYHFSTLGYFDIKTEVFIRARKKISQLLSIKMIKETTFTTSDSFKLEEIFIYLYKCLENELKEFDKNSVRNRLLNEISYCISHRDIAVETIKNSEEIQNEKSVEAAYETKKEMSEFISDLIFLIDINETIERDAGKNIDVADIQYFIAFSRWIGILKIQSLALEFGDESTSLSIDFELLPQLNESESIIAKAALKNEKQKKYTGYNIKNGELDAKFFEKVCVAFENDTKIKLGDLLDFIGFVSIDKKIKGLMINENVVRCSKNDIYEILSNKDFSIEIIDNIIEYLSLDSKLLKIADKEYEYIPMHNRTGRNSTILYKPIIKDKDSYYFSPALLYNLKKLLMNGFLDFFPPYHYGLKSVLKVIKKWKEEYEKSIEKDLCEKLKEYEFTYVNNSVTLSKLDVSAQHPSNLGDYDVIAIDSILKKIFLFECKVINKCGSYFETNRQQKSFFYEEKYDEKFQRRINYVNNNKVKVLKSFGIDNGAEYEVCSYMVSNKNFVSLYKDVEFDIVMYDEAIEIIGKIKKDKNS